MVIHPIPSAAFKQRLLHVSQQPQQVPELVSSIGDIWSCLWPRLTIASASLCLVLFVSSWVFMSGKLGKQLNESQSLFVSTAVSQDVGDMLLGWNQL